MRRVARSPSRCINLRLHSPTYYYIVLRLSRLYNMLLHRFDLSMVSALRHAPNGTAGTASVRW
jgi:hypothetical protein